MLLIHDDRDFTAIASQFPLQQQRWTKEEVDRSKVHEKGASYLK